MTKTEREQNKVSSMISQYSLNGPFKRGIKPMNPQEHTNSHTTTNSLLQKKSSRSEE